MMPELVTDTRSAALKLYDEQGWFVIPADPGAKKPYYGFTYKDRYGDTLPSREDVSCWPEWGKAGVRLGARTGAVSGIIVVDVDSQAAHEFIKTKGHPIGPMVQSPREGGGLHLYFRHPGFYVKSTVNLGGVDGLDIRGDYGIVVLPPSPDHKTGREYEWIIPPEDVSVPECPSWLIEILKKQSEFKQPLDVPSIMAGVSEGQRDTELNRLAGKLRQMNLPEDIAVPLIELAAEKCNPPFNKAEARSKVKWAYTHYQPGDDLTAILDLKIGGELKDSDALQTFSLASLMEKDFPPVKWAVKGLLPEGTMLFAGKPKMGKSWLALGVCISIATGGKALGEYEVEVGDVLYLALEDQPRRLQTRAAELLKSELAGDLPPKRLDLVTRAKKLDTGLVEQIENWLKAHSEGRLVVIDTLGSVKNGSADKRTLYEQDYEIGAKLTQLAGEYMVCILIIHHLRKGDAEDPLDMISGSTGLTGGMDGAMVLNRTRSAADGILKAVHRDLEDDPEIALIKVEPQQGWWRYGGEGEEYRLGKERQEILTVLADADGPMKPSQVADVLGKPAKNVSELLRKMLESGHVDTAGYGLYVASIKPPAQFLSPYPPRSGGSGGSLPLTLDSTSTTSMTSGGYLGAEEESLDF